jgi:NAD-dependent deacetylase
MFVLTGAGISVPSGVPDFRSSLSGLWENHRIEEIATPQALKTNHKLVYDFYQSRHEDYSKCNPNKAHIALRELESKHDVFIITQNVDDLHERAGSSNVIHMHGDIKHVRHIYTGELKLRSEITDITEWRPNVVLFTENIMFGSEIMKHLKSCHMFISIGTSNNVAPANGFHKMTSSVCKTIQLNKEETIGSDQFHEVILGYADEIVPDYVKTLLQ